MDEGLTQMCRGRRILSSVLDAGLESTRKEKMAEKWEVQIHGERKKKVTKELTGKMPIRRRMKPKEF